MSPPLIAIEDEGQKDVSVASSSTVEYNPQELKERNYLGLSDTSSAESSIISSLSENSKSNLNLKATELRLGLPGSQSPERDPDLHFVSSEKLDEKLLFPLLPLSQKTIVSSNKRGFSEASNEHSRVMNQKHAASNVPVAKAQVVGWPPVRSFRKNSLANTSRSNDGALFIKVSMDGAPYLRKVDLRNYKSYQGLSSALEKMFSCFIAGQCGSDGTPKEMQTECKSKDIPHKSEYVLTYEDKDGDWMLVGDVPWEMFMITCKKLKIMKGSDAIGLAPRATEKSTTKH